jgi:hypothetical protein
MIRRRTRYPYGIFTLALASRGLTPMRTELESEGVAPPQFASSTTWLLAAVLVASVVVLSLLQPAA